MWDKFQELKSEGRANRQEIDCAFQNEHDKQRRCKQKVKCLSAAT